MKKKKYILGLALAALSMTTLAGCGDEAQPTEPTEDKEDAVVEPKDNEITINLSNKEYDGKAITATATSLSGQTPKLEYKLEREADSEYSTEAPKAAGRYVVRATTEATNEYNAETAYKSFKITTDMLPQEYKQYENTAAYVKVTTAKEFFQAIEKAKSNYSTDITGVTKSEGYKTIAATTVRNSEANWIKFITKGLYLKEGNNYVKIDPNTPWDPDDTTYTKDLTYYEDSPYSAVSYSQTLTTPGTVKVIEIANDLDLGYNKIKNLGISTSFVENFDKSSKLFEGNTKYYLDPDIKEAGISQVKIQNTTDLLIYSKNGSKITHAGFGVTSCKDLQFKNLEFDEIWMWEDSITTDTSNIGKYDAVKWAYFKVDHCDNIKIDHCTFGKAFDGLIDYANPVYDSMGTAFRAPYGGTGSNSITVSYCDFKAGDISEGSYIYKMMKRIEDEYQVYLSNKNSYTSSEKTCRYYFSKRDSGMTFEDILYTYAMPQKKGFLWGDSDANGNPYLYNKRLFGIIYGCTFKNIETRLPKVRGGMVYVVNTQVDNSEYYPYAVKYGNTSEGILSGLGASVYLESVEYKGIKQYLKNNDSANSAYPTVNGGYMIKNSIFGTISGSTDKATNTDPFISLVDNTTKLNINNFAFKVDGEVTDLTESPISFEAYDLLTNGTLNKYFKENTSGAI